MPYVSGLLYEYYFICHRKLWYFSHGIAMENGSESVQEGKLIDESSYNRERKHILIDECANIDFLRDNTVYEIKKSSAQQDAAIAQIRYYLYVLKTKGIDAVGELRIPLEKKITPVTLDWNDYEEVKRNIASIEQIIEGDSVPSPVNGKRICKACAYYELCYI